VGQSEVEVAGAADTTVVLLAPGMGDGVQAAKAGILEIGDVFVVNKADQPGAGGTESTLRTMVERGASTAAGWQAPVVRTVAVRGDGIEDLLAALDGHRDWLTDSGELDRRRRRRAEAEIAAIALGMLRSRLIDSPGTGEVTALAAQVAAGSLDPHAAAAVLVASLRD
jgi:LAO/AO transport system kinase